VFKWCRLCGKNSLIFANDVWIIHVNFIVIATKFSEKKFEVLLSCCPHIIHIISFRGHSVGLCHNASPNIKYDPSPIEYLKLFSTLLLVTLLVEESDLNYHQYYILQATISLPLHNITGEEMHWFYRWGTRTGLQWRATDAEWTVLDMFLL
jgi:hypothetical protein